MLCTNILFILFVSLAINCIYIQASDTSVGSTIPSGECRDELLCDNHVNENFVSNSSSSKCFSEVAIEHNLVAILKSCETEEVPIADDSLYECLALQQLYSKFRRSERVIDIAAFVLKRLFSDFYRKPAKKAVYEQFEKEFVSVASLYINHVFPNSSISVQILRDIHIFSIQIVGKIPAVLEELRIAPSSNNPVAEKWVIHDDIVHFWNKKYHSDIYKDLGQLLHIYALEQLMSELQVGSINRLLADVDSSMTNLGVEVFVPITMQGTLKLDDSFPSDSVEWLDLIEYVAMTNARFWPHESLCLAKLFKQYMEQTRMGAFTSLYGECFLQSYELAKMVDQSEGYKFTPTYRKLVSRLVKGNSLKKLMAAFLRSKVVEAAVVYELLVLQEPRVEQSILDLSYDVALSEASRTDTDELVVTSVLNLLRGCLEIDRFVPLLPQTVVSTTLDKFPSSKFREAMFEYIMDNGQALVSTNVKISEETRAASRRRISNVCSLFQVLSNKTSVLSFFQKRNYQKLHSRLLRLKKKLGTR